VDVAHERCIRSQRLNSARCLSEEFRVTVAIEIDERKRAAESLSFGGAFDGESGAAGSGEIDFCV
jgi:hypothetical protein